MHELLQSHWAPYVAFAFACIAAWKAAELLEADNRLLAVGLGAAFAFFAPFLVDDLVFAALTEAAAGDSQVHATSDDVTEIVPRLVASLSRIGFALVGVAVWCGFERTA